MTERKIHFRLPGHGCAEKQSKKDDAETPDSISSVVVLPVVLVRCMYKV
jgi:hypothetical protein